jgi:hypothetical protein
MLLRNKVKELPGERAKLLEKYTVAEDDGKLRHPDFVYTL